MANNTSKGITYPTSGDSITPLETIFATLANTTNTALGAINAGTDITAGTLPLTRGGTGGTTAATARTSLAVPSLDESAQRAGKNKIINGAFDIWQRGTSFSTAGTAFTADRWSTVIAGTTTVSQETVDLPTGFQQGIKFVTSAAASYAQYKTFMERANVIPLRGQTVTISGYVKIAGSYAGNLTGQVYYSNATDASASVTTQVGTNTTIATSTTTAWTRFSFTSTIPSDAIGLGIWFVPDTAQPTGVTVRMTGIQLEIGSTLTAFSRFGGDIGAELAACQRYYYRESAGSVSAAYLNIKGSTPSTTACRMQWPLPTTMRIPPTAVDYPALGAGGLLQVGSQSTLSTLVAATAVTAIAVLSNYTTASQATVEFTVSSVTISTPCYVAALANGYLGVSAEL